MEWWNSFVAWLFSNDVARVFNAVVIPTLAILIAGIIGALIGRGSTKRIVSLYERDQRMAAVLGAIDAARRAARWNLLSNPDQHHADTLALEADLRLRLLPTQGASMAADWVTHEIGQMKRDSVSFSFQAEQTLVEVRNRMLQWHERPGRAKKLFKNDLDAWAYEATLAEESLVAQQQAWAAEQANGARAQIQQEPVPDAPRQEAPRQEAPRQEAPGQDALVPEAQVQDAPAAAAPAAGAPVGDSAVTAVAPPPAYESPASPEMDTPASRVSDPPVADVSDQELAAAPPPAPESQHDRPIPASSVRERIHGPSVDSPAHPTDH